MKFWIGLFLTGVALNIAVGAEGWPAVFSGHLSDPDSYMRLVRIAQGIKAGHLVNLVHGLGPGPGIVVEWSRLFDALLWLAAAPLAPFLGWRHALFAAGIASGPVIAGLLVIALAFVAEPFAARRFLWLLVPAAMLLPALSNYQGPGVVTQHIMLLVLLAATAGCIIRADPQDSFWSFLAGIAGGFAIWLTPEAMPYVLLAYGLLFMRWLRAPTGAGLAACGAGFFDVLGFGLAVDPPQGGYGVLEADRISAVFVALGLVLLLIGVLCWRLQNLPDTRMRRLLGAAAALLLLALWLASFPKTLAGPYGLMTPSEASAFFGVIQEMQPATPSAVSFAFLWPGCFAVAFAAMRCFQRRSLEWAYLLAALMLVLGLGIAFLRFAPVPAAAGAILAVIALQDVSARFVARPVLAASLRIGLIAGILLPPVFAPALHKPAPSLAAPAGPSCDIRHFAPAIAHAAGQMVLTDINDTPEFLWRSQILAVAGLYHHGIAGFTRARAAWRAPPGTTAPPAAFTATGARYVVFCTTPGRSLLVADLAAPTLWDSLQANHPPAWLIQRAADEKTGWRLYRVAASP